MKKNRKVWLVLLLLSGIARASETDADIVKDLDFFVNMDVVKEDVVFDESLGVDDFSHVATKVTPAPETSGEVK